MKTEQITIRLPEDRVALLKRAAKVEHRSLAKQIEHLLTIADKVAPTLNPVEDAP